MALSTTLTDVQLCLGFAHDDVHDRTVRLTLNGAGVTVPLVGPGAGLDAYNERTGGSRDLAKILLDALNAGEATLGTGRSWTLEWNHNTPGFIAYKRDAAGTGGAGINWGSALTTADPRWWGFMPDATALMQSDLRITAPWQARRLWLPPRFASVNLPDPVRVGACVPNYRRGTTRRWKWGGSISTEIQLARVPELFIRIDASNNTSLLQSRPGVSVGDPNVALDALWGDALLTDALCRFWNDEGNLASYIEGSLNDPGNFRSINTAATRINTQGRKWNVKFELLSPE